MYIFDRPKAKKLNSGLMGLSRREMVKVGLGTAAASALLPLSELFAQTPLITKAIPSSGEKIPIIGIGTDRFGWSGYAGSREEHPELNGKEAGSPEVRAQLKEVVRQLAELGGKMVDTASLYQNGASETLLGEFISELGNRDRLFLATKVNATGKEAGIAQIELSFRRLRTNRIDLIAVHLMNSTNVQLPTLREMKQAGRIRYVGITSGNGAEPTPEEIGRYGEIETVLKTQKVDFLQINYALNNRKAADRLLPLAADRGVAVVANSPFSREPHTTNLRLFNAIQNQTLPDWAAEFDCKSWGQFFLKYVVSHPAVTCSIPGTRTVAHLLDNIQVAQGRLPDAAMRRRMEEFIDKV